MSRRDHMNARECEMHDSLANVFERMRQHKGFFCSKGVPTMPSVVEGLGDDGRLLLKVIAPPLGHESSSSAVRNKILFVAEKIACGIGGVTKLVVGMDVFHGQRTEVARPSVSLAEQFQSAKKSGEVDPEKLGEAVAVYTIDRRDTFTSSVLPYSWDDSTTSPPVWLQNLDTTVSPDAGTRMMGVIPESLRASMDAPLYENSPLFKQLATACDEAADQDSIRQKVSRTVIQMLAGPLKCILLIPTDHEFGDDLPGLIERSKQMTIDPPGSPEP